MPSGPRSRRLPEPWVFFVDRSLGGKVLAEALRALGERVEVHDDHFPRDATDEVWLADVGTKGWVILSKDDRIRRNPVERQALLTAGVAAFFLGRSDLRGDQMASAFSAALPAMKKALRRFFVPFIAGVSQRGDVHVFETEGKHLCATEASQTLGRLFHLPAGWDDPFASTGAECWSALVSRAILANLGHILGSGSAFPICMSLG